MSESRHDVDQEGRYVFKRRGKLVKSFPEVESCGTFKYCDRDGCWVATTLGKAREIAKKYGVGPVNIS